MRHRQDPIHNLWREAVGESLCAAYASWPKPGSWPGTLGVDEPACCTHFWCQGILDVWNRMFGSHSKVMFGGREGA